MWEAAFSRQDETQKLENCLNTFIQPAFNQCRLLLREHLLVKSNTDILQDCEGKEAFVWSVAAAIRDNLLHALRPAP